MADENTIDPRDRLLREAHEFLGYFYARMLKGKPLTPELWELRGGIWSVPDRMGAWLEEHDAMLAAAAQTPMEDTSSGKTVGEG